MVVGGGFPDAEALITYDDALAKPMLARPNKSHVPWFGWNPYDKDRLVMGVVMYRRKSNNVDARPLQMLKTPSVPAVVQPPPASDAIPVSVAAPAPAMVVQPPAASDAIPVPVATPSPVLPETQVASTLLTVSPVVASQPQSSEEVKKEEYMCEKCGKPCRSEEHLAEHLERRHSKKVMNEKPKVDAGSYYYFVCRKCPALFISLDDLGKS